MCISLSLNVYSEGSEETSVVSGNRMVPAGVSHVCFQCLLSHTVREHVILFVHTHNNTSSGFSFYLVTKDKEVT